MNDMIENKMQTPIEIALGIDENGMTTARKLYEFLGMDSRNYSRWVRNNIQITEWSCDECKRRFSPNCQFDSDEKQCKKYFSEMNQPFTIRRG